MSSIPNESSPPRAFLCHSSLDRDLVVRLATDLLHNGVDVWYAEWELQPGDSLRQRIIDEGIEGAPIFLALLTRNSLDSRWAKTENRRWL